MLYFRAAGSGTATNFESITAPPTVGLPWRPPKYQRYWTGSARTAASARVDPSISSFRNVLTGGHGSSSFRFEALWPSNPVIVSRPVPLRRSWRHGASRAGPSYGLPGQPSTGSLLNADPGSHSVSGQPRPFRRSGDSRA